MKIKFIIGMIIILSLVGCTTSSEPCIQQECPVCNNTVQKAAVILEKGILYDYFINVGQGDSQLITYNNHSILIDCGKNSEGVDVVNFIEDKNIHSLDYLIMSHLDSDHIGGCDDVLNAKSIKVNSVITNGEKKDTSAYNEVISALGSTQLITARTEQELDFDDVKITIIQTNNTDEDSNQNSIVTLLKFKQISVLSTGDCDKQCDAYLSEKNLSTVTLLKVAHHGSKFGTSLQLLELTKPKIAIISVGQNDYGHPSSEALDRLSQEGITVYRTDLRGNIAFRTNGFTYEIN